MNNIEMKIATEKLKGQRQGKGWTQQHLSDISGLSLRTIQRSESNGNCSTETLSALSAVYEVERSYWAVDSFSKSEKQHIINKGWRIALQSMALAHVLTLFLVWLLMGSINSLWFKALLAIWLLIGFSYFVVRFTAQQHNLKSWQDYKILRDKLNEK